jgi:hypothetical protein
MRNGAIAIMVVITEQNRPAHSEAQPNALFIAAVVPRYSGGKALAIPSRYFVLECPLPEAEALRELCISRRDGCDRISRKLDSAQTEAISSCLIKLHEWPYRGSLESFLSYFPGELAEAATLVFEQNGLDLQYMSLTGSLPLKEFDAPLGAHQQGDIIRIEDAGPLVNVLRYM